MIRDWPIRALLAVFIRFFPRDFRRAFGSGMLDTLVADFRNARALGPMHAVAFLIATPWDLIKSGIHERLDPTWRKPPAQPHGNAEVTTMLQHWMKDLAYAARALARAPGFTSVTLTTLTLAIGANVAIFTVIDAVLLDPLPYANPDRLVQITSSAPGSDFPEEFGVSEEFFVQYSEEASLLEELGIFNSFGSTFRTDAFAERLRMSVATASFFSTLGATPILGRLPDPTDTDEVAVISHALWTTRLGSDPNVVGRSFEMAGEMRTVIGVLGPEFRLPEAETMAWIPYVSTADIVPSRFWWLLVAKKKPGITDEDLIAQLTPLAARLPERFGGSARYARLIEQYRPIVEPLKDAIVGEVAGALWVLLGTVGVVLLIACANVANLLVVRSDNRQRELAVRQALGASRGRLIQGQMAESALLGLVGAASGLALAWASVPLLVRAAPERLPRADAIAIDGKALAFTAIVAIITAIIFGLAPALRSSAASQLSHLRHAGRGSAAGPPKHVGRDILVVVQTALALVLLVGSGLLIRSFYSLRNVDPGYETADIFSFQVAPSVDLPDASAMARFHYDLMERLSGLPGVQSVGVVHYLPLDEGTPRTSWVTEDAQQETESLPLLPFAQTGGDYFQTMDIALRRGRVFTRADHETDLGNAIVSESTAELLWPGQDPIGKRLRFASDSSGWETVVGVVEDIHQNDFRESDGLLIYLPLVGRSPGAWAVHSPGYVLKTSRAEHIAAEVRELVRGVDQGAPFYAVHTMAGLAAESMARLSFTMLNLGLASFLALVLGSVGLYGVLSYVVTQRTQEIGVRMALGATAREVRWMVVRQGGRLALIGVGTGVLAAVAVTRVLDTLLFGVGAIDASTFTAMSAVMLLVAVLASYVPARRASSVDPIRSLRAE